MSLLHSRIPIGFILCVFIAIQGTANPEKPAKVEQELSPSSVQTLDNLSLYFIENKGQIDKSMKYHLKMPCGNVFFSSESILYQFLNGTPASKIPRPTEQQEKQEASQVISIENLLISFEGASKEVKVEGREKSAARFNFLSGNDPNKWIEGSPAYHRLVYQNLYPQVDLVVYGHKGLIKHEYRIKKGGLAEDILIRYDGAKSVGVNDQGQLKIETNSRILLEDTPVSYQIIKGKKVWVDTEYVAAKGNEVRFKLGDYSPEHELVIDPFLIYSTFLGGTLSEGGSGIAIDLHLDVYVAGATSSGNFPTTPGAYDRQRNGGDVFLTKLDSSGSQILFSTFFGGSDSDYGTGIAFSWDDESPVITGETSSSDFPTTANAYDRILNGSNDIFIAKFNSTGGLRFSSYFGGGSDESNPQVALDGAGNIYIIGNTSSSDFYTSPGAVDSQFDELHPLHPDYPQHDNLFVAKFNTTVSNLEYSTLFGDADIWPGGISVEYYGNAYITGATRLGSSIPTTPGVYCDVPHDWGDGFIASFNPSGTQLNYSTYYGDNPCRDESKVWPQGISVDADGKALVTGNYYCEGPANYWFAFVQGFNSDGTQKLFYREFKGDGWEFSIGKDIAVDGRGGVYIICHTDIADFDTSEDAIQSQLKGNYDLYLVKLRTSNGNTLYSTYLGGQQGDFGGSVVADSFGAAYITGTTDSLDFPTTAGAYSILHSGNSDAFIAKIRDAGPQGELHLNKSKLFFSTPHQSVNTVTKKITLTNTGKGVANYEIATNQTWLSVWPTSGDVRTEQDSIDVTADPDKLKTGTHQGIVKVSSTDAFNSPQQLIVSLKVKGPTIRLKRRKFTFTTAAGGANPAPRQSKIKNKGPGSLRYKFTPKVSWLSVTPKKGVSTGEWDTFKIKVNISGMSTGAYTGIIEVTSQDTMDTAKMTITLNITPAP